MLNVGSWGGGAYSLVVSTMRESQNKIVLHLNIPQEEKKKETINKFIKKEKVFTLYTIKQINKNISIIIYIWPETVVITIHLKGGGGVKGVTFDIVQKHLYTSRTIKKKKTENWK